MQIDVHNVETHVAGTATSQQGIEVRSVVVEQASATMYQFGNLGYLFLENTQCVGVGHHDTGYRIVEQRFEFRDIYRTFGRGRNFDNLQSTHCRTGGICTVGTVGDDYFGALQVTSLDVVLSHQH